MDKHITDNLKDGRQAVRVDVLITNNKNDLLHFQSVAKNLHINKELFNG